MIRAFVPWVLTANSFIYNENWLLEFSCHHQLETLTYKEVERNQALQTQSVPLYLKFLVFSIDN